MKILLSVFLLVAVLFQSDGKFNKETCTCKGKKLQGKVKVVTSFPDFRVKVVDAFPDMEVKKVRTTFTHNCGEWIFVDTFPDFTIQYADAFPDFSIKFKD
jgi:hypothetical protein